KGPTTRRAASSSVLTSPATFAEIIRRAEEILRRPESGNPGRSAKPIRVGKPRIVDNPGLAGATRHSNPKSNVQTCSCNLFSRSASVLRIHDGPSLLRRGNP
ncbi:hypothetical protein U1Q18_043077, partial [Sarracenia purpurea var. burkii]